MFEEIKAIVAENLGADKASITPETSFSEDLKADSLDLFEMVWHLKSILELIFRQRIWNS